MHFSGYVIMEFFVGQNEAVLDAGHALRSLGSALRAEARVPLESAGSGVSGVCRFVDHTNEADFGYQAPRRADGLTLYTTISARAERKSMDAILCENRVRADGKMLIFDLSGSHRRRCKGIPMMRSERPDEFHVEKPSLETNEEYPQAVQCLNSIGHLIDGPSGTTFQRSAIRPLLWAYRRLAESGLKISLADAACRNVHFMADDAGNCRDFVAIRETDSFAVNAIRMYMFTELWRFATESSIGCSRILHKGENWWVFRTQFFVAVVRWVIALERCVDGYALDAGNVVVRNPPENVATFSHAGRYDVTVALELDVGVLPSE